MIFFRRPKVRIVAHQRFEPTHDVPHPAIGWFECTVDGRRGWPVLAFPESDGRLGVWFGERPQR